MWKRRRKRRALAEQASQAEERRASDASEATNDGAVDSDETMAPSDRPVFLPLILSVVLVFFGIYLAIHIGLVSSSFMEDLNRPKPALAAVPPKLGTPTTRRARRVVVVVIDGLRLEDSYGLSYLDGLRRMGVDASATSHYPTISRPNHVTIVTGVPPRASGVRTNAYSDPVMLDSLMDRAGDGAMQSAFVGDYTDGLPLMFSRPTESGHRSPFHDANRASWPGGLEASLRRMVADDYPLVVCIAGGVDAAGHEFGGDTVEYRRATREIDALLARALAGLDFEHDALVITADHGHTDPGGHGGIETEVMEVPLILVGAGVRAGAAITEAELIDVAPTVAALLGMPAPGHGLGRTLLEALSLTDDDRDTLDQADDERVRRNRELVNAWQASGRQQVARARIWRVPFIGVAVAVGVCLILFARRFGALQIDWRVLLIAMPSFPVSYYLLLAVFGQQFSPSFVPERGNVEDLLFRFGLMSTGAQIVASWFAFRGRVVLAERLATANGLFLCGLLASLSVLGLFWAIWPGPFIEPPPPVLFVLIPATYVACACFALAVVTTLTLEIIVFFARAVDPRLLRRRRRRRGRKRRKRSPR